MGLQGWIGVGLLLWVLGVVLFLLGMQIVLSLHPEDPPEEERKRTIDFVNVRCAICGRVYPNPAPDPAGYCTGCGQLTMYEVDR